MTKKIIFIALFLGFSVLTACQTSHQVEVKPIETVHKIEPIHITIDVNIRVEKALDDFFGDIEAAEDKIKK
jgi:hypothetical protein